MKKELRNDDGNVIEGRNAVSEAIAAGRHIDKLFIAKGAEGTLKVIAAKARDAGIVVVETERRRLDEMSVTGSHQGVIASAAVRSYCQVSDILEIAAQRGEAPLIIVCDEITDTQNLGAIIRTAEAAGAHGLIIPKRRSAGLTAAVDRASAGAAEHMAVARVPNITQAIKALKDEGLWIFGSSADGTTGLYDLDMTGPAALVIGSEGEGMSRLVSENCDYIVRIPMAGKVNSLNASVSAALIIYEAVRQRSGH